MIHIQMKRYKNIIHESNAKCYKHTQEDIQGLLKKTK